MKDAKDEVDVILPGRFHSLVLAAYIDFEHHSSLYQYNPHVVNGVDGAKVNIFLKEIPSFIEVQHHPTLEGKDFLRIRNYNELPRNFIVLVRASVSSDTKSNVQDV